MASTKRVNFDVTPEQESELSWLREALGASSTKEAVLRAVRVLAVLSREAGQGAQLYVQAPDGQRVRILVPELESVGSGWDYLSFRPHSWRKQPWLKGTRIRASTIWTDMEVNGLTAEEMARDLELPLAAVREAHAWCSAHRELLQLEALEEQQRLAASGVAVGPGPAR